MNSLEPITVTFKNYPVEIHNGSKSLKFFPRCEFNAMIRDIDIFQDGEGKYKMDGVMTILIGGAVLDTFDLDGEKTGITEIDKAISERILNHIRLDKKQIKEEIDDEVKKVERGEK